MRRILTRGKQAVTCTSGRETETEEQTDFTRFSIASVPSNCELEIAPAQMCTSNRPLLWQQQGIATGCCSIHIRLPCHTEGQNTIRPGSWNSWKKKKYVCIKRAGYDASSEPCCQFNWTKKYFPCGAWKQHLWNLLQNRQNGEQSQLQPVLQNKSQGFC